LGDVGKFKSGTNIEGVCFRTATNSGGEGMRTGANSFQNSLANKNIVFPHPTPVSYPD